MREREGTENKRERERGGENKERERERERVGRELKERNFPLYELFDRSLCRSFKQPASVLCMYIYIYIYMCVCVYVCMYLFASFLS